MGKIKFKIGDRVKIIGNDWKSANKVGDIGIIVDDDTEVRFEVGYKISVEGREQSENWSADYDIIKVIRNTALARKMYPNSVKEGEWLWIS